MAPRTENFQVLVLLRTLGAVVQVVNVQVLPIDEFGKPARYLAPLASTCALFYALTACLLPVVRG